MWTELKAGLDTNGVVTVEHHLDAKTVRSLIDTFEAPASPAEAGGNTATLVKRGVVFARRNLLGSTYVQQFIANPAVQSLIGALAPGHLAVRGILFDKTSDANWTVPWHQDRSIAVAARYDTPGFGPWSTKAGVVHVQPPVELLQSMLTLRFSLDPCGADNGPLRAIPGTHRSLLSQAEVTDIVERSAETGCTTDAGGVVIMRPLLLHASSPARHASRRRVLHIEFGPPGLPVSSSGPWPEGYAMEPTLNLPPILPPGTQVVTDADAYSVSGSVVHPRGAVGVIVQAPGDPWHAYRVRFPDGFEASFKRQDLVVLSQFQTGELSGADPVAGADLHDDVIYRCVMGSRAYGLDDDASDTDRRGIYLPPADRHWSLYGVPEQLENEATQEVYWELQKFLTLALKANPNVLECLYTPLVEHAGPVAHGLLESRSIFLSKLVYQTYNGYVMSQFKKLQSDLRNRGEAKPKHMMHLIRLLLAGIATLRDGVVPVHVGEHRTALLAIKRGEMPFPDVDVWRQALHKEFDDAFASTTLPDRPDYAAANALLIDARRSMV